MKSLSTPKPSRSSKPSTHFHFHSLDPSEIKALTRILSHQPSPLHAKDSSTQKIYRSLTKKDIHTLPEHLKNRASAFERAKNRYLDEERVKEGGLCVMHEGLGKAVVRCIWGWIRREIERVPGLIASAVGGGLSGDMVAMFEPLKDVRGMWRDVESESLGGVGDGKKRWARQSDGCKACMLARLGGEEDILVPLRASVITRLCSRDVARSKRLMWLESLIEGGFEEDWARKMMQKSDEVMKVVKSALRRRRNEEEMERSPVSLPSPLFRDRRRVQESRIVDVVKDVQDSDGAITSSTHLRADREKQQYEAEKQQQQPSSPTGLSILSRGESWYDSRTSSLSDEIPENDEIYDRIASVVDLYSLSDCIPGYIDRSLLNPGRNSKRVSSFYDGSMRESVASNGSEMRELYAPLNISARERAEEYSNLLREDEEEFLRDH